MLSSEKLFPGLTAYGNYESGIVPPKGIYRIPLDGSIRKVKKLGIPCVDIVDVELAYGSTYLPRRVGYAIPARYKRTFTAALGSCQLQKVSRMPKPHPDLLLCIREASRAAHRERDAATKAYSDGRRTLGGNAKERKNKWYALKDRGIIAAHKQGFVWYIGASPQGMAVYEYGVGGKNCLHSTLHPAGANRTPVEGHPETLFVAAKDKMPGISLVRVEVTLAALSSDTNGYERSAAPRVQRQELVCWKCGELGHLATECLNECWACGECHAGKGCHTDEEEGEGVCAD